MFQLLKEFKHYMLYNEEEIDTLPGFCVPDVSF